MRLLLCLLLLVALKPIQADPPADSTPTTITIGPLTVDAEKRQIRMQVRLAITEGILEYLVVEAKGKTYESLFTWEGAKGSELNFALLLLGSEPLDFQKFTAWRETPGEGDMQSAPLPTLPKNAGWRARLEQDGQPISWDRLLTSREGNLPSSLDFIHTGSFFTEDNRFAADINLSHLALWQDGSAILNLIDKSGNPYRGNLGFEINKAHPHVKDTAYTLILEPLFQSAPITEKK